ncbi:MAG TPA: TerB family tellurite resistance protein [Rhodospirillaceae bacterium]|nr:TerB family tellurite resistance protein [Rhodospirillaceae bacterium]|tara:strand:+ start:830 stop:1312 length:483 start_codon:yes stop_codon:yes gene_type:complete
MLAKLKSWAERVSSAPEIADAPAADAAELAAATALLLAEAASLDGDFDADEAAAIERLLTGEFDIDAAEAAALVADARERTDATVELYSVTRTIKDRMPPEDRVRILEMIWSVAYADGEVHDFESNLARRVAGLLHVTDRDAGAARKRAIARLEQDGVAH